MLPFIIFLSLLVIGQGLAFSNEMLVGNKQSWLESGCVYGYRKIHLDLRDSGQRCGINRVWRLMMKCAIKFTSFNLC